MDRTPIRENFYDALTGVGLFLLPRVIFLKPSDNDNPTYVVFARVCTQINDEYHESVFHEQRIRATIVVL